jgi:hypothetical protein
VCPTLLHLPYIHITDPHTPTTGQQYTGIKGQGSYLTRHSGKALRLPLSSSPKPLTSLSHALISLSFPRHAHARLLPPQLPSNSGSMGHSPQYLHPHRKGLILPPSRRQPGPRRHQRENGAHSPFCWEYCSHFRDGCSGRDRYCLACHLFILAPPTCCIFVQDYGTGLNFSFREIGSWEWDVCAGIATVQEA